MADEKVSLRMLVVKNNFDPLPASKPGLCSNGSQRITDHHISGKPLFTIIILHVDSRS
jgi:hypothetical protein